MKFRTLLMAAAASVTMATAAYAVPISGSYSLSLGRVTTDSVDYSKASMINFSSTGTGSSGTFATFNTFSFNPSAVTNCTACGTINTITNVPMTASGAFTAVNPLFTVEGLSFSLNSLNQVIRNINSTTGSSSLEIVGTGLFSYAGYDTTAGTFDLTIQNGSATIQAASGSASGTLTSVPEPASLALLGASLATIGFIRRRKQG